MGCRQMGFGYWMTFTHIQSFIIMLVSEEIPISMRQLLDQNKEKILITERKNFC